MEINKSIIGSRQLNLSAIATTLLSIIAAFAASNAAAQAVIITEDFSTATFKDSGATSADWETTSGVLRLPLSGSANPIQSLNNPFTPASTSSAIDAADESRTRAVVAGDLDGDGDLDLYFGNSGANKVYFNAGGGTFVAGAPMPDDFFGTGNTRSAALEDFNGDGFLDVVRAEFDSNQPTRLHFNNRSGTTSVFTQGSFVDLGPASLKGDSVVAGDIDNDGDSDIVLGIRGGYVKLFFNDGFGNFSAPVDVADSGVSSTGFHARSVVLGDLDNDGDLDIVAAREYGDNRVYRNDGSGGFSASPSQTAGAGAVNNVNSPDSIALGDVNGDGFLDLIVGNDGSNAGLSGSPGSKPNRLFINSGNSSSFFPSVTFEFTQLAFTNGVRLADVDRDGDLDIVTADSGMPNSGTPEEDPSPNHLYINDPVANAPNIFPGTGIEIGSDVLTSKSLAVVDIDGDGDLDIVIANQQDDPTAPTTTGINQLILNTGTLSGVNADQLFATSRSLKVNNGGNSLSSGIIVVPVGTSAVAHQAFTYWISDDSGLSWIKAHPGMSVDFLDTVGTDLRWRVEMNNLSPQVRPALTSLQLRVSDQPFFTSTAITAATEDALYTYVIRATDPDAGDALLFADNGTLPAWLVLTNNNDGTATLSGTPTNDNVGTVGNDVSIIVRDTGGRNRVQGFTINVANVNDAPTVILPIGDISLTEGDMVNISVVPVFEDVDGDTLTYSATGLPASLSIDSVTGIVSGTLTDADAVASPFAVSITADDGNTGTVSDNFTLTVNDVAGAPRFDSTPVTTGRAGTAYSYAVMTSDPDAADTLTITATVIPGWLTLTDNGDGTASLAGTPAAGNVGAANVALRVTDSAGTFVEQAFVITVQAATPPPPPPPAPRSGGGSESPLLLLLLAGVLINRQRRKRA